MQIDLAHEIKEVPLRRVRDFFRWTGCSECSVSGAVNFLKCDDAEAACLLEALVEEGFLKRGTQPRQYELTDAGIRLSAANAWKRFPRAKAEPVIARLIANAEAINKHPDYLYYVGELRVFGSYLDPSAETLGDVDIARKLVRRPQYERSWSDACLARADVSGRGMGTILARLSFAEREVMTALRSGARYAQFTDHETLENLAVVSKVIFKM